MTTTLQHETAVINAQHAMETRMRAQIKALTIKLAAARGERVSLNDRFELNEIVERFPEFNNL